MDKTRIITGSSSSTYYSYRYACFHKGRLIRENIEPSSHTIEYLSSYLPDLNFIEQKRFQAKSLGRKYDCNIDQFFNCFDLELIYTELAIVNVFLKKRLEIILK